jgi:dienelactone hydrolase
MKNVRLSSFTIALLLALLPVAGRSFGQGQATGGSERSGVFTYTRRPVSFVETGRTKPIEATLTLPRTGRPLPAVVIVTGAWDAGREGLGEAEALRSFADYLGAHGIAALQLKAPLGGRSTGDLSSAGGASFEPDIRAGIAYLKQRSGIDSRRIGLFGQNENGAIAAVTATLTRDVAFLILAGTAITEHTPASGTSAPRTNYDLRPVLSRVNCPILVVQGDQDPQLPVRENLTAFRNALVEAKNEQVAFAALPGLNRALETTTGNGRSETEMAPLAMRTMVRWVNRDASGQEKPDNVGDEREEVTHRNRTNRYGDVPGGVIGQFRYRPEMDWVPPIAGQARPYGYWYW